MRILAIETSCDDTAIAILEAKTQKNPDFNVLSNVVSSQIKVHQQYGGVFPMLAKREHQANLVPVLKKTLQQAKLVTPLSKDKQQNSIKLKTIDKILEREPELKKQLLLFLTKHGKPEIDCIAVTKGPGLEPCLWVGVNFAKTLSYLWSKPIIPVDHIESHILVNLLENKITFPAIALIVSGGHTQLVLVKNIGKYKIIGETRDDAAGECFDKAAHMLGLSYPGGPVIAEIASKVNNPKGPVALPRPMINSKDYDFSFSGLKTALLYALKDINSENLKSEKFLQEICFEVQQAIIDVLLKKTIKAAKDFGVKTIILGGGVSANQELRRQMKEAVAKEIPGTSSVFPNITLSTDNALMIAITAFFHRNKKIAGQNLKANANLRISK